MFDTFNMGVGYVIIVSPQDVDSTIIYFNSCDITANQIGEVIEKF
jgi:phosphoribosylformylglycinamidine cyclo-ligase